METNLAKIIENSVTHGRGYDAGKRIPGFVQDSLDYIDSENKKLGLELSSALTEYKLMMDLISQATNSQIDDLRPAIDIFNRRSEQLIERLTTIENSFQLISELYESIIVEYGTLEYLRERKFNLFIDKELKNGQR